MTDLADWTIEETTSGLRRREVSAREVCAAVLARAAETEPTVHAYVDIDADHALAQAADLDEQATRGDRLGPLHGVTFGIKDVIDVAGIPTRAGSRALADALPAVEDAAVVTRLRRAGAVIVGKTVPHEFGFAGNVPPTRNAWNPEAAPGGSSAGSAVAVAVGSAHAALGTDTGGSVRVPAAVNGVLGLKPSWGSVPVRGAIAMSPGMDTVGLLCRSASDAARIWSVVSATEYVEPSPRVAGLRIGRLAPYIDTGIDSGLALDVAARVEDALAILRAQGARDTPATWPADGVPGLVGMALAFSDTATELNDLLRTRPADFEPGTLACLASGVALPADALRYARRLRERVRRQLDRLFEVMDLLAFPSFPVGAGPAEDLVRSDAQVLQAALDTQMLANLSGRPAITIPCGLTEEGMPVGLQLLGRHGSETMLFEVAATVQTASESHLARPAIDGSAR